LIPKVPSPVIDTSEIRCPQDQVSNTDCWRIETHFQWNNLNI